MFVRSITLGTTFAVCLATAGVANAVTEEARVDQMIAQVAPEVLEATASATMGTGGISVLSDSPEATVTVPFDPKDGIEIIREGSLPITVGLPSATHADDAKSVNHGAVSYDNNDGTQTVPVLKDNGSVQIVTTIEGSSSPERFEYPVTLPKGASLSADEYGGVYATGADGSLIATVDPAWAKDASGTDVSTRYEIDGSTLVQIVEHRDVGVVYPVVADPWWGIQYKVSSAAANKLAALANAGAGASGIAAVICSGTIVGIPCGAALGVAAGILVIGGSLISLCNAKGKGIYINQFWVGGWTCTARK